MVKIGLNCTATGAMWLLARLSTQPLLYCLHMANLTQLVTFWEH